MKDSGALEDWAVDYTGPSVLLDEWNGRYGKVHYCS